MAKIRPSRTVNPRIETTCPFTVTTTPASPFTRHRSQLRPRQRERHRTAGHVLGAAHHGGCGDPLGATVGSEDDVGVEHADQRREVTATRCREERVHDLALARRVGVGRRLRAVHAPARSARELPGRFGRALDHGCDLVERHREHVVQHERETLRWVECLEHDQQRQAHGVGEHDRVARVDRVNRLPGHDRIGHPRLERLLAPRAPGAQHVEAHAGGDGRQPPIEVVDARRARLGSPSTRSPEARRLRRSASRASDTRRRAAAAVAARTAR